MRNCKSIQTSVALCCVICKKKNEMTDHDVAVKSTMGLCEEAELCLPLEGDFPATLKIY